MFVVVGKRRESKSRLLHQLTPVVQNVIQLQFTCAIRIVKTTTMNGFENEQRLVAQFSFDKQGWFALNISAFPSLNTVGSESTDAPVSRGKAFLLVCATSDIGELNRFERTCVRPFFESTKTNPNDFVYLVFRRVPNRLRATASCAHRLLCRAITVL